MSSLIRYGGQLLHLVAFLVFKLGQSAGSSSEQVRLDFPTDVHIYKLSFALPTIHTVFPFTEIQLLPTTNPAILSSVSLPAASSGKQSVGSLKCIGWVVNGYQTFQVLYQ